MIALDIDNLSKTYLPAKTALRNISLQVPQGELFALLGPNGAGKTTLIGIVCGVVRKTSGNVRVHGLDIEKNWRQARRLIGLVPQELTLNPFDTVWNTLRFQRGFYGRSKNNALLEQIIDQLALSDKLSTPVRNLSGGMKRRVLIGKALTNEPDILFLDEPSAGVDVELRQGMWNLVKELRDKGTTIILTTHYLEEAERLADRIGIINNGILELVERTSSLKARHGEKKIIVQLAKRIDYLPTALQNLRAELKPSGEEIEFIYDGNASTAMEFLTLTAQESQLVLANLEMKERSLEEIFLTIIKSGPNLP